MDDPPPVADSKQPVTEFLEEFKALRSEILLRIQLRSQTLGLTVTLFAAITALTGNSTIPKEVLLVYPVLALCIAFEWAAHDQHIFLGSLYIKTRIEPHCEGLRWQHYLDKTRERRVLRMSSLAAGGILVGASIVTLLMSIREILKGTFGPSYGQWIWVPIVLDVCAICGSIYVIRLRKADQATYVRSIETPEGVQPRVS